MTDDAVAVVEHVAGEIAELSVVSDGDPIGRTEWRLSELPNRTPGRGDVYVAGLEAGDVVSLTHDPEATAREVYAKTGVDLIRGISLVRPRDGPRTLRVEFVRRANVGRRRYDCSVFLRTIGSSVADHATDTSFGLQFAWSNEEFDISLESLLESLAAEGVPDYDDGLAFDIAVLLSVNVSEAPTGSPFDPGWTPPSCDEYDIERWDDVVLDPE